jgi:hypothetical protein
MQREGYHTLIVESEGKATWGNKKFKQNFGQKTVKQDLQKLSMEAYRIQSDQCAVHWCTFVATTYS